MGDHHATCRGNGDMIRRHDSLRDVLFSAAQSAALAPKKETPSLIPGFSSRPADIFLPCWKRGKPAALESLRSNSSPLRMLPSLRAMLYLWVKQGNAEFVKTSAMKLGYPFYRWWLSPLEDGVGKWLTQ